MRNLPKSGSSANDPRPVDLSIIIVSWNVIDLLMDCLDSILENSIMLMTPREERMRFEVIVVDSASEDDTVDKIRKHFTRVKLFPQTENVGFVRGNNIGIKEAKGRYILLLNPDTVVLGNALKDMVDYMEDNADVGIVGPYTLNTNGTVQPTRRRFPTIKTAFFESTWLQPFAPESLLNHYYVRDLPDLAIIDVDWVQGSAMMIRKEVFDQIGLLDPGYVMYSEELDFCRRAKDDNWRVVYHCCSQIIHHGGKSSEQISVQKHIWFQQSKLRYFHKYHGWMVAQALRIFLLASYSWQIILELIKTILLQKWSMRRKRIADYLRVIRSGLRVT
jgi:N-acetylglucosaminyl-diphospho-decaprenol L-rhamnosyltransferase